MKRFWLTAVFCMICTLPALAPARENPWDKKLPFKGVTLHYVLSGSQEGVEDRYIRDYGRELATYHKATTVMMGMKLDSEIVEIQDADWIYTYDLKEKTGAKAANPQKFMLEEYGKLSAAEKEQVRKNAEAMGAGVMKGMSGKKEQNAVTILGYSCDRTSVMGSTIYTMHEAPIPLKTETDIAGMKMESVATSLTEGEPDAKFFEHPAGIEAVYNQEADEMSKAMAVQTIAMLKDPDGLKKMSGRPAGVPGN